VAEHLPSTCEAPASTSIPSKIKGRFYFVFLITACTGQKRVKDTQGVGSSSKKQKRSHKATVVNNKKKGKGSKYKICFEASRSKNNSCPPPQRLFDYRIILHFFPHNLKSHTGWTVGAHL
jgi:hypothetical protein